MIELIIALTLLALFFIVAFCLIWESEEKWREERSIDDLDQEEYEKELKQERKDCEIIDYGWAVKK